MNDWGKAIAVVELFRAEAELEVQEIEDEQRKVWRDIPKSERKEVVAKKWPWHMDSSKPPEAPPRDQIPKMAVYDRIELMDLLQVAPPEALRELYDQINGGPQMKGWKHGVMELSLMLRELFRQQRMREDKKK